jgi:polysaccharide pyruvyl transferase WcaK-like protein
VIDLQTATSAILNICISIWHYIEILMNRLKKVVIAGEIWSPNLGDGIIADSMQFLLKEVQHDLQVRLLDISGRDAMSPVLPQKVSFAKQFMQSKSILRIFLNVLRWRVRKKQYLSSWTSIISEADAVIIGGGQLLMDNALDFPLKINAVSWLAHSFGKTTHFVSCGVGKKWSFGASQLFRNAIRGSSSISVRDTISAQRLQRLLPGTQVRLSADPALWAADVYGQNNNTSPNLVGLGIISVDLINRHRRRAKLSLEDLTRFWLEVASRLHHRGVKFELFTNGSTDDYEFARHVSNEIADRLSIPCALVGRPTTASELARTISRYKAVVASRLHAHILATSYLVPSVALVWDDKVHGFFKDTGREDLAYDDFSVSTADAVVASLINIMGGLVSKQMLEEKRSLILENLSTILSSQR